MGKSFVIPVIKQFEADGYAVVECMTSTDEASHLVQACTDAAMLKGHAGTRQVHRIVPAIATFLQCGTVKNLVERILPGAFPVRSILFDKTPTANWGVPWHQDLTICVQEKLESPGFGPWSIKDGLVHVQPPMEILEQMVTMRLHLDACPAENGALKVIPGSHVHGRISAAEISRRSKSPGIVCGVGQGGALFMRPLLLHSSRPSAEPSHRRVLHVEFAAIKLPEPLRWNL